MIETVSVFGQQISLFYLFWLLSVVFAFFVGCRIRERYQFSVLKCAVYIAFDALFGVLFLFGTSWLYGGGINFVRIVPLLWIYFSLLAWVFKDSYKSVFDFLTVAGAFLFAVARLGCIFPGCCHGFPSEWGLYSNAAGAVCFPIQLIESLVSVIIAIILVRMSKNPRFYGKIYPYYLVLFGATRFFLEFLRDNDKLVWNISELALHAMAAFILGTIILLVMRTGKKAEA